MLTSRVRPQPDLTESTSDATEFSDSTLSRQFLFKKPSLSSRLFKIAMNEPKVEPDSSSIEEHVQENQVQEEPRPLAQAPPLSSSTSFHADLGDVGTYLFGQAVNDDVRSSTLLENLHVDLPEHHDEHESIISPVDQERVLSTLNSFQDGLPLLLARVKESMSSSKEVSTFLKKRAMIEEEYAKSLLKLCSVSIKVEGKAGSFHDSWTQLIKVQETIAETKAQNAAILAELAEDVNQVFKSTERSRKQLKDAGARFAKEVNDAENGLEKAKSKYDQSSEDWEKAQFFEMSQANQLAVPVNNPKKTAFQKSFNMLKASIPANFKFQKTEEEARTKASLANDNYKAQLQTTNAIRKSYFDQHLPKLIRELKDTNDESDAKLLKHLMRYCRQLEVALMTEAQILSPIDSSSVGLVKIAEQIDNGKDFEEYMNQYLQSREPVDKTERQYVAYIPHKEMSKSISGSLAELAGPASTIPAFGMDLPRLMEHDPTGSPVPLVVLKCVDFIEKIGMQSTGLYRVSGASGHVQKLRQAFIRDPVNFQLTQDVQDVNEVASILKLFFRELPDPLFPRELYKQFIEAAKIEDERLRLIQIHELVNMLHDANYATLKCLTGHLWRVKAYESENKMSVGNLAIVWGPTLMDSPDSTPDPTELNKQSKVVEIVITNYEHIFDTE